MDQRTLEWLEWRRKGIGASEVPSLMGESDFSTPYKIWEEKLGLVEKKEASEWAQKRGELNEPKIRALYELKNDLDMPPGVAEHHNLSFIRASLDGWNREQNVLAEFKCIGAEKHELTKNGGIPGCYFGQVMAQLFVTGANWCDYVSYSEFGPDAGKIFVVRAYPDEVYFIKMVQVLEDFWKCVTDKTPPPLTKKDERMLAKRQKAAAT